MMKWEELLSLQKQGVQGKREKQYESPERSSFDVDYDRVIFSDSFRSLQDKTQVIPLSKDGFVHTRLTHSLEVSVVGRSLGRLVGANIIEQYPHLQEMGYNSYDVGAIVASAALSHDIGNPPFGHSGEKAIGDFFLHKEGKVLQGLMTEKEYADLCYFEGNANGFRILTKGLSGVEGGLRLSYAALGSFVKYPKESLPHKPSKEISEKKYNFFQSEKDFFQEVAQELRLIEKKHLHGMAFHRHPLVYLVEAADDICYTLIDFEDGINLGWIEEHFALEYLMPLVKDNSLGEQYILSKYKKMSQKKDRIAYLRAISIGTLIQEAQHIFIKHQRELLEGNFHHSLLQRSVYHKEIAQIIDISREKIYNSPQVIEKEIAGYNILQQILRVYFTAIYNNYLGKCTSYDELVFKLLPSGYIVKEKSIYEQVLHLTCYVASLTDSKVTQLHNRIMGGV